MRVRLVFGAEPRRPAQEPRSVLNQRAPNSSHENVGNVPQFRVAPTLTSDRDTLATAPAQGEEERLGMGLSFPRIFLRIDPAEVEP